MMGVTPFTFEATMKPRQSAIPALVAVVVGAIASIGCSEIPQDARKPFAGPAETKGAAAFHAERARTQDEYLITGDAKVVPGVVVAGEPKK
jgi:hypothetical protein